MRRPTTTVFIAGWIGFLAVSAAISSLAIVGLAFPAVEAPSLLRSPVDLAIAELVRGGNPAVLAATAGAIASAATAAFLALAGWLLQSSGRTDRSTGERLVLACLAAVGLLVAAAHATGSTAFPIAGSMFGFEVVVALSALAVLFDRVLDADAIEDDGDELEGAVMLGRHMAHEALRLRPAPKDAERNR